MSRLPRNGSVLLLIRSSSGYGVGFFGVVRYCLLINGLRGIPGWALGSPVIGIALGLSFRITKKMNNRAIAQTMNNGAILISVTAGILGVKSLTESLLYLQPLAVRAAKKSYAWTADMAALVMSLPFAALMDWKIRGTVPRLFEK